jgi:hypothetical protein
MYYLSEGLSKKGLPKLGKFLAVLFAILCVGGSFGGGNMFQANQSFAQLANVFPVFNGFGFVYGIFLALLVGVVIIGGIKKIAKVTDKLVPFMVGLYLIASLYIILANITNIGALANLSVTNTATIGNLIVTGNLSVGNLIANSANYANFAGVANTANSVAGANVTGTVANANYSAYSGNATIANSANSVAVANVSGIGNIATVNLDGNLSNVLYGNGVFATISIPAGDQISNGTSNVSIPSANSNVEVYANNQHWTFSDAGNLILAGGNGVIQSIANSSLDPIVPNVSTMVLTPEQGYTSQALVLDPTTPGHIHLRAPGSNIDQP